LSSQRREIKCEVQNGHGSYKRVEKSLQAWVWGRRELRCTKATMSLHSAIEIRLGSDEEMLFVQVRVPPAAELHLLDAIRCKVDELFAAVEQMDGRQPQHVLTQEMHAGDIENNNFVVWSREYTDPEFPARFELALRALAAAGIVPSLH
jgi:hypothetical protein